MTTFGGEGEIWHTDQNYKASYLTQMYILKIVLDVSRKVEACVKLPFPSYSVSEALSWILAYHCTEVGLPELGTCLHSLKATLCIFVILFVPFICL